MKANALALSLIRIAGTSTALVSWGGYPVTNPVACWQFFQSHRGIGDSGVTLELGQWAWWEHVSDEAVEWVLERWLRDGTARTGERVYAPFGRYAKNDAQAAQSEAGA
jgi:hypothetical protein